MKDNGADMDFKTMTALRALYEQRACPPDKVLFSEIRTMEMEAHLGYCRYCNERIDMTVADTGAWEELGRRLMPILAEKKHKPLPVPGQIWSLDQERLGGWGPYDRYYTPPLVLVLQLQDNGRTVRVAQVCAEEYLKGDDSTDVWLDNSIGFAESWNTYSVHRDDLYVCRGEVNRTLAEQVLDLSRRPPLDSKLRPLIHKFRELEVQVGAFIATQALQQVMEAIELVEEREVAALEESSPQLELIKGFFLEVKYTGEKIITMAYEAFEKISETFTFRPLNAMEPARSADFAQNGQASRPEMSDFVDIMKEQEIPFVPVKMYPANDSTNISVRKITRMETYPTIVVTYKNSIIESSKIAFECWETEQPKIVIKDHWISMSKLQQADYSLRITFKDGKAIIDILPA